MGNDLFQFALTAFVMLIVVVNPIIISPIFAGVTKGADAPTRSGILRRAIFIAFCIALFFLLVGRLFLSYLGVSIYSFAISGGILLFVMAFPMLFGDKSSVQTPEDKQVKSPDSGDPAIFP
ncbi:MAG TPA: MarC family protein, partial [Patescibacteria group bacterium]|nr:MarC family protein [Patescibacteria group bacterium]